MKILFFARHYSYLRLFEASIAERCEKLALDINGTRLVCVGSRSDTRISRSEPHRDVPQVRGANLPVVCGSVSITCVISTRAMPIRLI